MHGKDPENTSPAGTSPRGYDVTAENSNLCKLDVCRKQALYYLVYGCLNEHVADTRVCRKHLEMVRELTDRKVFRCYSCANPVITGQYRLIHGKARNIITRWLDGREAGTTPNPDYMT